MDNSHGDHDLFNRSKAEQQADRPWATGRSELSNKKRVQMLRAKP